MADSVYDPIFAAYNSCMAILDHPVPDPPLPMLITGLTGVSGYNAFHHFRRRFPGQVVGMRQMNNWPMQGEGIVGCDAEDYDGLSRLFEQYRFASVLNCAGNCALKSCELDPEMAWRINLSCVRNLIDVIQDWETRFVHLSIDLVFSGRGQGGHLEDDRTDPVTMYGKSMAAAEQLVRLSIPSAAILRISLPMGISYSGHAGAIDWIQARFQQNKPATLYYDEIRTPTYTDCLNAVFSHVLSSDVRGIHHAGGPRRLSLYQIAQIVNRVGGYDPDLLIGCYRREAGPMPPRAGNVTMDSSRLAEAIGATCDPWPISDEMAPGDRRWHYERQSDPPGSYERVKNLLYVNPRIARLARLSSKSEASETSESPP